MERYRIINGQRYELHHTATAKGYISRKVTEKMEEYTGSMAPATRYTVPVLTLPTITMLRR